ncbi:Protein-glutamine N-methyltransferase [gamma proteobacterium HdN1]|nr:Protein-glutamine N-methyltransferase [gamma proteobacterium HdN1]
MRDNPTQIRNVLRAAVQRLQASSLSPQLDAELLLCAVLERGRTWLRIHDGECLNAAQARAFDDWLERRLRGEPVAYLLGCQEFWSLPLKVAPCTLIPRPDTERLVEVALARAPENCTTVLDLGTGTGAIALALKHERRHWHVTATDRVEMAAALASENAQQLGLSLEVLESDWLAALTGRRFDLIVSNPPYIDPHDPHLRGDGVSYEPLSALVAEHGGLGDLKTIVEHAPQHLCAEGVLALEHGYDQAQAVGRLLLGAGFDDIQTHHDYGGQVRVTSAVWRGDSSDFTS